MRELYDPIRKTWVKATPEEIVRQQWIYRMVKHKKFPEGGLAVEKELKGLPHLKEKAVPERRLDIICFAPQKKGYLPLLLLECKAGLLTNEALSQVIGYNHYVQAPYVAIVNEKEIIFRYTASLEELDFLPTYQELLEWVP